jgi:hypothetical protein
MSHSVEQLKHCHVAQWRFFPPPPENELTASVTLSETLAQQWIQARLHAVRSMRFHAFSGNIPDPFFEVEFRPARANGFARPCSRQYRELKRTRSNALWRAQVGHEFSD